MEGIAYLQTHRRAEQNKVNPVLRLLSVCYQISGCCRENCRFSSSRAGFFGFRNKLLIPTRCRDLYLKQFCLEDIAPAVLIILIAHIILAVRWMFIKILSVVINHRGEYKVIVPGGLNVL